MQNTNNDKPQKELRIIKTARSEKTINEAVEQGFWPLVKPVIPSPEIKAKYAVLQDRQTGKMRVTHDFRTADIPLIKSVLPNMLGFNKPEPKSGVVIGWTFYYPYHFESPFAAYLIPPDLQVGEEVMLEDLIEDIVGQQWSQGDTYRLASCKAVWNGNEFILQPDPNERAIVIG